MSHEIRFNRGNRARTVYGRETIVVEQGGPNNCMVMCEDGRWYHPTKVWKIDADKDFTSATDEELMQQPLPSIVRDAIEASRKDCEDVSREGFVVIKDVNGDGIEDYILDYGKCHSVGPASACGGTRNVVGICVARSPAE